MFRLILYLMIVIIVFCSCESEDELKVNPYTVRLNQFVPDESRIINTISKNSYKISVLKKNNGYETESYYEFYHNIFGIDIKKHILLDNGIKVIEYFNEYNFYIGINKTIKDENSFYLKWINSPVHLRKNRKSKADVDPWVFNWGISIDTDTVWTNITKAELGKMFPDFRGSYIYDSTLQNIIIDYSISPKRKEFYENIKFQR